MLELKCQGVATRIATKAHCSINYEVIYSCHWIVIVVFAMPRVVVGRWRLVVKFDLSGTSSGSVGKKTEEVDFGTGVRCVSKNLIFSKRFETSLDGS